MLKCMTVYLTFFLPLENCDHFLCHMNKRLLLTIYIGSFVGLFFCAMTHSLVEVPWRRVVRIDPQLQKLISTHFPLWCAAITNISTRWVSSWDWHQRRLLLILIKPELLLQLDSCFSSPSPTSSELRALSFQSYSSFLPSPTFFTPYLLFLFFFPLK